MNFSTGSLVKARGREWVVLPGSDERLIILKPLGGSDEEIAGIICRLKKLNRLHSTFRTLQLPVITGHAKCFGTL